MFDVPAAKQAKLYFSMLKSKPDQDGGRRRRRKTRKKIKKKKRKNKRKNKTKRRKKSRR